MGWPVAANRIPIKSKYFAKKYGGMWVYDGMSTWWCDDNRRHISRVQSCSCDDKCNHYPDYRLYGDGINGTIDFN